MQELWLKENSCNVKLCALIMHYMMFWHRPQCSYTGLSWQLDLPLCGRRLTPPPQKKARLGWTAGRQAGSNPVWFQWLGDEVCKWCVAMVLSTAPTQADGHQAGDRWLLLIPCLKCFHAGPHSIHDHTETQPYRWSVALTAQFNLAPEQRFGVCMNVWRYILNPRDKICLSLFLFLFLWRGSD